LLKRNFSNLKASSLVRCESIKQERKKRVMENLLKKKKKNAMAWVG
jgi:hypothetical protein